MTTEIYNKIIGYVANQAGNKGVFLVNQRDEVVVYGSNEAMKEAEQEEGEGGMVIRKIRYGEILEIIENTKEGVCFDRESYERYFPLEKKSGRKAIIDEEEYDEDHPYIVVKTD